MSDDRCPHCDALVIRSPGYGSAGRHAWDCPEFRRGEANAAAARHLNAQHRRESDARYLAHRAAQRWYGSAGNADTCTCADCTQARSA